MPYRPALVLLEAKHPLEVVDFRLQFSPWLATSETLSTTVVAEVASGLTLTPSGKPVPTVTADTDVVFWLGGGTSGTTYLGELKVTTSSGRTLVVAFQIEVVDPAPTIPA